MCWTTGPGAAGSFSSNAIFSHGFGTRRGGATQSGCVGIISIDNVATSDTARVRNTTLLHVLATATTTDYTVSLSSFSAGSFDVTYSSAANASSDIFHYCVWGGTTATDAIVINQTMGTGTITITGTGFRPNVLFGLDSDLATTDTITAALEYGFGMASSPTQAQSLAVTATTGDTVTTTMNWNQATRSGECLQRLTIDADTVDARWTFTSFGTDGATLGALDAPANSGRIATFLFIQGGAWEVGNKAKITTTGDDTFTLATTALIPKGVFLFGIRNTAVGVNNGRADFTLGASDGVHTGVAGIANPEAINTRSDCFHATDRVIEELLGGQPPTEASEATLSSMNAGNFILNWSVNNGAANLIMYLACGDNILPANSLDLLGVGW